MKLRVGYRLDQGHTTTNLVGIHLTQLSLGRLSDEVNMGPPTLISQFSAVVLAGGQSRRMGRDKRALPWIPRPDGSLQTVLQHVVASLSNQISDVVLVANDDPDIRDVRVVGDMYPNAGSLGGIYSGLKAANHELAFVAAADMPFLNLERGHLLNPSFFYSPTSQLTQVQYQFPVNVFPWLKH